MDDPNWAGFIPDLKSGGPKCRMPTHEDCSPIEPDAAGLFADVPSGAALKNPEGRFPEQTQ